MPQLSAQDVILEILRTSDGEWVGKTRLFKAFYFAHLYFAKENPGILTSWPMARMPQGPGINNSDELFEQLESIGLVSLEKVHDGPYTEYRYRLTPKGNSQAAAPEAAKRAIEQSVNFCKDKTAAQLSAITHERSRSWNYGQNGDILDIYIDIIPDDEYQKRQKELARLNSALVGVFDEA
jgi:hypothetical protein